MIYDNEFNCPDGHKFRANAKIRARCPDCGKQARRTYNEQVSGTPPSGVAGGKTVAASTAEPPVTPKGVQLIKQGKPREMPKTKSKQTGKTFTKAKAKLTSSNKIVRSHIVKASAKKPVMPVVKKTPKRTAVARHLNMPSKAKSYTDEMIERYGRA